MKGVRPSIDPRWLYLLIVGSLVVFHWVNNWIWVSTNVTLLGWDRPSHLGKSLIYYRTLRRITPVSLFTAMTWQGYRPPLVFLMASLFYKIFGVSTDVALMSNSLYVAILLLAVYGIGKSIYGKAVGLMAALLTSLFPILFALSRTFYVDYALVAFVSLSIYLLLESDDLRDRGFSLLFGLSLGLGMLVKWSFLAFVAGPFTYTLLRLFFLGPEAPVPPLSRGELGRLKATCRHILAHPLLHLVGGFLLTLIWYLPNKGRVAKLALGGWLFWLSWLLISLTIYSLSRRPSPRMNLCSALLLGISIAAPWYLPNIGFLRTFLFVAYGGGGLDVEKIDFLNPATYSHYLALLARQISPFYFIAFLAALAFLAWHTIRRPTLRGGFWREVKRGEWVLLTWLVVSYFIFTLSFTRSARYTVPLLPPVAIITARGLLMVKNARTKSLLLSLLVVTGLFQFLVLSYDGLAWLGEEATWQLPMVGKVPLVAPGGYIQTPNRGATDSRYWVAPEILQSLHERAKIRGQRVKLGLLISNAHLNGDILNYLILLKYDGVELLDLARGRRWKPIYPHMFESDFVLLADGSLEYLCEEAKDAMERLRESPAFFREVFELTEEYPLPDGDTVYLYRKRYHLAGAYNPDDYRGVGEKIDSLGREGDGIVIVPPQQIEVLARYLWRDDMGIYPLPREETYPEEMEKELAEIITGDGRVFGVFWDERAIENVHAVERWLNEHGYRAWERWYGGVRLVIYGPSFGEEGVYRSLGVRLGDKIILDGYRLIDDKIRAGDIMRLIVHWRTEGEVGKDYKVFIHLLDQEGRLVVQRDSEPMGGMKPTSGWEVGKEVVDRYGVLVGEGTPSGRYELVVGIYEPESGERLPIVDKDGRIIGDKVSLGIVEVVDE